jgi:hypothetical protein
VVGPGAIGERERESGGGGEARTNALAFPGERDSARAFTCALLCGRSGFRCFRAAAVWDRSSVKMRIIKQHPVLYDRV